MEEQTATTADRPSADAPMKIRSIAPWFGGKRTLAPRIVQELGQHTQYFEPFCGSMAVLLAKAPSQKETVCDLHGDLINLAEVLQIRPAAELLYDRLQRTLFSEQLLRDARIHLDSLPPWEISPGYRDAPAMSRMTTRAYWYFLASWMGRNGTAGTARLDYQIAVRWTKNGGSPTVRFRNAIESIPAWHERLKNVVILRRDAFQILDRFEDCSGTAIYADPPYAAETRSQSLKNGRGGTYLHEFQHEATLIEPDDHARLAEILRGYRKARVVVSYYDTPRVRQLYDGWTFVDCTRRKHLPLQNQPRSRTKHPESTGSKTFVAPEVLIINGPSYTDPQP